MPGHAERSEAVVGVEVGEVCVARGVDEVEYSELACELLVRLLRRTAEVRAAQLPRPGRFGFDRRDDEVSQRERLTLPRHAVPPFGARITVIVRPSKLSRPCDARRRGHLPRGVRGASGPASGCSRSRPRKKTTTFTESRLRRNSSAWSRFHA